MYFLIFASCEPLTVFKTFSSLYLYRCLDLTIVLCKAVNLNDRQYIVRKVTSLPTELHRLPLTNIFEQLLQKTNVHESRPFIYTKTPDLWSCPSGQLGNDQCRTPIVCIVHGVYGVLPQLVFICS